MFFWLEGAIYTGAIPAIAIAVLVIETVFLLWLYRRYQRAALIIANAMAGGATLVAVYVLATGGSALLVAALLVTSLVAHLCDIAFRHRLFIQPARSGSSAKPAN